MKASLIDRVYLNGISVSSKISSNSFARFFSSLYCIFSELIQPKKVAVTNKLTLIRKKYKCYQS